MYSHIHYDHFNKDDILAIGSALDYLALLGFAGDTGNFPYFKDVGEQFGNIDICLLSITSYQCEEAPAC